MNKFEIKTDEYDPTLIKLTYWSTSTSGMSFRMAPADLQDLMTLIQNYQGGTAQ